MPQFSQGHIPLPCDLAAPVPQRSLRFPTEPGTLVHSKLPHFCFCFGCSPMTVNPAQAALLPERLKTQGFSHSANTQHRHKYPQTRRAAQTNPAKALPHRSCWPTAKYMCWFMHVCVCVSSCNITVMLDKWKRGNLYLNGAEPPVTLLPHSTLDSDVSEQWALFLTPHSNVRVCLSLRQS